MNWLRKLMIGRYGPDQLGFVLLSISILISVIGSIADSKLCLMISYIPFAWYAFRMFSKNIYKRASENSKFLALYMPIEKAVKERGRLLFGTKTHRYYKCSGCKQTIRVPKKRGKIEITCPKCKNRFIKKT